MYRKPDVNNKNRILQRNSSLELLRIISMFLIVMHHYSYHGNFSINREIFSWNTYYVDVLVMGGKIGVNCFVLISAYFMLETKYKIDKLIKLMLQVFFYSLLFLIIYLMSNKSSPMIYKVRSVFPFSLNAYWFASTYFLLFLVTPLLNICINNISNKQHKYFIGILFIIWSLIPTCLGFLPKQRVTGASFSSLGWFIYLYFVATYLKKYYDFEKISKAKYLIFIGIVLFFILLLKVMIITQLKVKIPFFHNVRIYNCYAMNDVLVFFISLFLFGGFLKLELHNQFINKMASTTFGIYLIHENFIFRDVLWVNIFKNNTYFNSNLLYLHSIVSIIIVFFSCSLIDFFRGTIANYFYQITLISNILNKSSHMSMNLMDDNH
jgi:hypothetical protein